MPNAADRPRRVTVERDGPILVEGPVEVLRDDGTVAVSDRFVVAVCTCRRSRAYPWCDTSHRGRRRPATAEHPGRDERKPDHDPKGSAPHDGDHR
ncbi:CDGSH iron-sulfur domain-containing protein [Actinacidiphila sp. ITFR-21]|uniref:CDGSH iron-sulfur domain-containing protein n=1 Tax=Actinacidiphila sp. ITFR-21 TaxID=3075199 RepID=UPI00288933E2|nr:CDGSH iron-sulfur domain-containing protein [Streptomyces sp. ITFR-21]WNI14888.1 CDGSH iron-sulfur domain-containing protein [Streptomyces sp. ITFR-21]